LTSCSDQTIAAKNRVAARLYDDRNTEYGSPSLFQGKHDTQQATRSGLATGTFALHNHSSALILKRMNHISFTLEPAPPFRLDITVWLLRRRAENVIDRWEDGNSYRRVLIAQPNPVEVEVVQEGPPNRPLLRVTATGTKLSPDTEGVVGSALTRMLGIDADLSEFYRLAERQPKLDALVRKFRGVKPPRYPTLFEALVNAIACQQISLTVGIIILSRLGAAFGPSVVKQGIPAYGFPGARSLSTVETDELRRLGFSRQKARAIIELASAVSEKQLDLDELENLESEAAAAHLRQLRGVGRWSAEYVLLRGLGRLDVFPGDDVGARTNLQRWLDLREPLDYAQVWNSIAPWRAYGGLIYFHLLLRRLAEAGYINVEEEGQNQ